MGTGVFFFYIILILQSVVLLLLSCFVTKRSYSLQIGREGGFFSLVYHCSTSSGLLSFPLFWSTTYLPATLPPINKQQRHPVDLKRGKIPFHMF